MRASPLSTAFVLILGLIVSTDLVEAGTLKIGTVAKDVKEELEEFEPLAIYLEGKLSEAGFERVEIVVLPTAARMTEAFKSGEVDLYVESPLVAARVGDDGGAVPLVRRWKKGVGEYWSEIIVLSNSAVKTPADLRGRVIAFEDPDSTSGHLLPRALLLTHGLHIEILRHATSPPSPSNVGAVFTLGDQTSILWLLAGRVDAIATDPSFVRQIEAERPGAIRSIARTISVPRHVVMRAAGMGETQAAQIADILIGMADSEDGRRALSLFGKTDRFDAFPAGVEATFEPIREQLRLLDAEGTYSGPTQ
ncbi:MAG: phosphate/phosphite/phosphonate ABC transporter substrate-binding protein [Hyphomicrobiales bacterium]